jgi:hypothetical protein
MLSIPTTPSTPAAQPPAGATSAATAVQPPRPCPACCGEGYLVTIGAPGYFDDHEGCWMPTETLDPCDACCGTGREPTSGSSPHPDVTTSPSHAELADPEPPLEF